jgi:3-hydroxyacyl-CoA dehydrogenase
MVRRSGSDIEAAFEVLFAAGISDNAHEARQWGLLDAAEPVKMAEDRILNGAIDIGLELAAQGYEPPLKRPLNVAGQQAAVGIYESLERRLASGEIGPHDREVGACLARVLCGVGAGDPEPARGLPGEDEMLDLEREVFLELSRMDATRQRIEHMLKTGKRLRN